MFRNWTSELTIDAYVSVPLVQYDAPPTVDGTVQVSFFYYVTDTTTDTTFAHVIALFDNRSPGVNGTRNFRFLRGFLQTYYSRSKF